MLLVTMVIVSPLSRDNLISVGYKVVSFKLRTMLVIASPRLDNGVNLIFVTPLLLLIVVAE